MGIVGAGQLARMTAIAAWPLGIRVAVLGAEGEPAVGPSAGLVVGDWRDAEAIARLAAVSTVVTLENEFVPAAHLARIEDTGAIVRPGSATLAGLQDKALQKALLADAGLPVAPFRVPGAKSELAAIGRDLGWPLVLKRRTLGYDGYGNATCHDLASAEVAWDALSRGEDDALLVEGFVTFERELAVMVARRPGGEEACYPVMETVQREHVCREVLAPAPIPDSQRAEAERVARAAASAAGGVGVTGVEMFALPGGVVCLNELAPRPHNSGHLTIEACETSQFENHLRGVLDLPLGATTLRAPGAVMINLLGERDGPLAAHLTAPWPWPAPTSTSTTSGRSGCDARWGT